MRFAVYSTPGLRFSMRFAVYSAPGIRFLMRFPLYSAPGLRFSWTRDVNIEAFPMITSFEGSKYRDFYNDLNLQACRYRIFFTMI
jgi:hypothetical protein